MVGFLKIKTFLNNVSSLIYDGYCCIITVLDKDDYQPRRRCFAEGLRRFTVMGVDQGFGACKYYKVLQTPNYLPCQALERTLLLGWRGF